MKRKLSKLQKEILKTLYDKEGNWYWLNFLCYTILKNRGLADKRQHLSLYGQHEGKYIISGAQLNIFRVSLSRSLHQLQRQGLVKLESDEKSKRKPRPIAKISLTEEGKRLQNGPVIVNKTGFIWRNIQTRH